MAVLIKKQILSLIKKKELVFSPKLDAFQVQPHSVDLRLGYIFYISNPWKMTKEGRVAISVDPLNSSSNGDNFTKVVLKQGQYFELLPKEFVITVTLEKLKINTGNIMAVLYPRSSVNRRGLSVDLTGIIDVWYDGPLMIPIINNTENQNIRLYPGERFCQITFETLSEQIPKKEGQRHGLRKAKYSGSDNHDIECRLDKKIERELIKSGEINKLKDKFSV